MHKTALFGAAALLAALIPVSSASAQSGHVGINYNNGSIDLGGPSADFDGWSADGVVAFDMGSGWGSQLGVTYADNSLTGGDLKDTGIDGHIYHRDASLQWGGALAYHTIDGFGGSSVNTWTGAGEARWFMSSASLGGTVSYSHVSGAGSSVHSWGLDGDGHFFLSDNFQLNAGLGYETLSGSGSSAHGWHGDVGAEWQFTSMPISIYGGYGANDFSSSGPDANAHVFTLGARWNFGGGTLHQRDTTGANLGHVSGPYERIFFGS